jgi:hypothetical protein
LFTHGHYREVVDDHVGRTAHRLDQRGTVRDWLVGPVWSDPADDLAGYLRPSGSPWGNRGRWVLTNGPDVTPLKQALYRSRPLSRDCPAGHPVEGRPLSYAGRAGTWQRCHTAEDGLVDWSEFCFTPEYRLAVAAVTMEVDQAGWRTLRVASTGPTLLFHHGTLIGESATVSYMEPVEYAVLAWLPSRLSTVVITSWQVAFRECRQVLRLRVEGLPIRVVVPSPGADESVSELAEQVVDAVGLTGWGTSTGRARLVGPDGARLLVNGSPVTLTGGGATVPLVAGGPSGPDRPDPDVGPASMLAAGTRALRVAVADDRAPVYRELPVAVLPSHYRARPEGTPEGWRAELLAHVSTVDGVATPLARGTVQDADLVGALGMLARRADCADFEAVGLLNLWHRVPADRWAPGLRERVRASLLGFKYWIDQPGLDAMCYFTENHQLVWHTAEILAGEAFPSERFGNTGWTGSAHAEHGRALAREWLHRRLAGGFSEFDSNAYLAIDLLAAVSLAEFARDTKLAELAAGLADRVLFTLATNSWRGIHAGAHGRSYVPALRSSRLAETAPIMWLCFGIGALNEAALPATVLATAQRYAVPEAIVAVAHDRTEEWYGRQRYRGRYRFEHDLLDRPYGSEVLVYRTPDAMLASVQDYRVGLPGLQEHVWGATLGPETQVFVTHPANASISSSARPNAWAGNRILPRVRQLRDTVLAIHQIPAGDPMGYTHAWFPVSTMDEWTSRDGWLAGRVGDGYVALATEGGVEPVTAGPDAWQEWRAGGPGPVWVCTVGRRAVHGSFAEFVSALDRPCFGPDRVAYRGLRLGWTGPLTVDGRVTVPDPDIQLENPACRLRHGEERMEIRAGGYTHRIDLRHGRPLPEPS